MREVLCPKGHRLQITEAHLGKQVRCPMCNEPFAIPEATGPGGPAANDPAQPPLAAPPGLTIGPRVVLFDPWAVRGLYAGRSLVFVGLLLVLGARGCDVLGKRAVDSAKAKETLAQKKFDDACEEKRSKIEDQIKRLTDAGTASEQAAKDLSKAQEDLSKLRDDQQKEKAALEKGAWRELQITSRDAGAHNQVSAYWRGWAFVVGTILLAFGLIVVSWHAQGAERWVSLIMLAIITFSVYVIGLAWTGLPM